MVNSTKDFIRITRDDSGEVAQFIVESFSTLLQYHGRRDMLGEAVVEEGPLYDCLIMRGSLLMKRDNIWTFQEGSFQTIVIKRKEVIEHHSFFFGEPYEAPVEENITEDDLPIFVNEDDDAGLIELEYKEPEFTSLHDAILDVLSEGPLDRLGISTRIYQKYNKSINPDRIKGALSILIHSGEALEKDNGTLNPLYFID